MISGLLDNITTTTTKHEARSLKALHEFYNARMDKLQALTFKDIEGYDFKAQMLRGALALERSIKGFHS